MSSARRTGGTGEGGGEAGMEKPTMDEVGSEDLEAEPASPAAGRSNDAHDFLRTGGADAGAGADVDEGVGTGAAEEEMASVGVGTVVSRDEVGTTEGGSGTSVGGDSWATIEAATPAARSHDSGLDFTSEWAVSAAETEVFEERGEVGTGGVSDTVEIFSEEETVSGKSLRGDSAGSEARFCGSSGVACVDEGSEGAAAMALGGVAKRAATAVFGDSGGVETRRAFSRTSCGGRERGEIMMPGARDGFVGRRDQIAQPPNCCFISIDVFCLFVDTDVGAGTREGGTGI
jgi:hypothetical protein